MNSDPIHLTLDGVNGFVFAVKDKGQHITITGWTDHSKFEDGRNIILHNRDGSETRYRIDKVKRCGDPDDMYFMDCTFNPRKPTTKGTK